MVSSGPYMLAAWGCAVQCVLQNVVWAKLTEWIFFVIIYMYSLEVILVSFLF